jgi:phosphohistidine phosphatase SixA
MRLSLVQHGDAVPEDVHRAPLSEMGRSEVAAVARFLTAGMLGWRPPAFH